MNLVGIAAEIFLFYFWRPEVVGGHCPSRVSRRVYFPAPSSFWKFQAFLGLWF
jgi:hypothetical protein